MSCFEVSSTISIPTTRAIIFLISFFFPGLILPFDLTTILS